MRCDFHGHYNRLLSVIHPVHACVIPSRIAAICWLHLIQSLQDCNIPISDKNTLPHPFSFLRTPLVLTSSIPFSSTVFIISFFRCIHRREALNNMLMTAILSLLVSRVSVMWSMLSRYRLSGHSWIFM